MSKEKDVRNAAFEKVSGITSPRLVGKIVRAFKRAPGKWERTQLAEAVGKIYSRYALNTLLALYVREKDPDIRAVFFSSLSRFRDEQYFIDVLVENLDKTPDSIFAIKNILKWLGDSGMVNGLTERLMNSDWAYKNIQYIILLSFLPGNKPRDLLIRFLEDPEEMVRSEAAALLGNLNDPKAHAALVQSLEKDPSAMVCKTILAAIHTHPNKLFIAPIEKIINNNQYDHETRGYALDVLSVINTSEVIPVLLRIIYEDSNFDFKLKAVEVLCKMKDKSVIDPLKDIMVNGTNSRFRFLAAKSLLDMHWEPAADEENIYCLIALKEWRDVEKIGTPAIEPLFHIQKITNDDDSEFFLVNIDTLIVTIYSRITTLCFGTPAAVQSPEIFQNPAIPHITEQLTNLRYVQMDMENFDPRIMEKIVTQLINAVGEKKLKAKVVLKVKGDLQEEKTNVKNLLKNVFHTIEHEPANE
ncbi:MAG: HEAT repeat domain-containing protein [Spirochaetales bacterium]|nr:HEAT repeat domain-containing protein [Spirochaetales bacterium]